ncbi:MAG: hypothetical protein KDD82_17075 [Planctomycetes bacterium]|nr:hypothetical protein [Planctomycetota bacterium]
MRLPPIVRCAALFAALLSLSACGGGPEPQPQANPDAPKAEQPKEEGQAAEAPPPEDDGNAPKGALADLTRELTLAEQEKRALAQHYFTTGMQSFEEFDYRTAAENFQKALDATPNDPRVRQFLLRAQLLGGIRQPEFESVAEELRRQREVKVDLERSELKRIYSEGEEFLEAHEYDKAINRFERVLEKIRWLPFKIDDAGLEDGARRYIVEARAQSRDQQRAEEEAQRARALERSMQQRERLRREQEREVRMLLQRALDQITLKKFNAAETTIQEVLLKDPQNEEAIKLRDLASEHRHVYTRDNTFEETERGRMLDKLNNLEATVPTFPRGLVEFPSRERWALVRERAKRTGISEANREDPLWIQDIKNTLASRTIELNFNPPVSLEDAIEYIHEYTGLNIRLGGEVDPEQEVQLQVKKIPVGNALKLILEQTGLKMIFDRETLAITLPENARGQFDLEIYPVMDLLSRIADFPGDQIRINSDTGGGGGGGGGGTQGFSFEGEDEEEGAILDPDQLDEIIRGAVGEEAFDSDEASMSVEQGQLIVSQTREVHRQIREVLKNLRRNNGLFVQVETRFIQLTDDFLRDIGVDLRGLGLSGLPPPNPAPFGQPMVLDQNIPSQLPRGFDDIGFGRQIPSGGNARASRLGPAGPGGIPFFGSGMFGGRTEHVLDGGNAYFSGLRLNDSGVSAGNNNKGAAFQIALLDPFQLNAIVRAEEERGKRKIVQAPVITAANRQRVSVSVITQRAYISDYELSSGGTGLTVAEVADPIVSTFSEGVVLDVRPTVSADRKYITLDVRPTLATLVGGTFRQIQVNLGTISNAAINVNIEVPQILLQQAYTSVTIPDGGTALLGGFRQINYKEERAGVPFIDHIPILNLIGGRQAEINENLSVLILLSAKTIYLPEEESRNFNVDDE